MNPAWMLLSAFWFAWAYPFIFRAGLFQQVQHRVHLVARDSMQVPVCW